MWMDPLWRRNQQFTRNSQLVRPQWYHETVFKTAIRKKRAVGVVLFLVILALFSSFNRFPKLDIVGEDLDAVTAPETQCFQGFCIEREAGTSFITSWVSFSAAYLRLVTVGMTFAFLVAGLAESFLFPAGSGRTLASGGVFSRTLKGAAMGPVMNLCSACIVPVSSAFQRKGAGVEGAIAMVQGSATMNIPALAMVFFVFTPLLGMSRLLLAIIGALLIGPLVVMTVRRPADDPNTGSVPVPYLEPWDSQPWRDVLVEGIRDWAKASLGYLIRLGPIMVVAAFASGLVIQWLSPAVVATYLGNDVAGVAIAATFGILINVPLLFEIPLVALLLLLGMGTAPAATLLFTAAAGGPATFWGLSKLMPKRAIATFAGATWGLGAFGGLAILGIGAFIWEGGETDLRVGQSEQRATYPALRPLVEASQRPIFVDVTEESGIDFLHRRLRMDAVDVGAGAVIFDFNTDGFQDIYITSNDGPNALYRNNRDGTFSEVAAAAGLDDRGGGTSNGGCAADYDNDGDPDLFVSHFGPSRFYRNNGDGTFSNVTSRSLGRVTPLERTMGCAWGDYDRDGHLDLVVVNHVRLSANVAIFGPNVEEVRQNPEFLKLHDPLILYHGNGDGTFTDVSRLLGDPSAPTMTGPLGNLWGAGFQPGWVDYDNDGDLDLYIVNDLGSQLQPNVLWRNDGPGADGGWIFTDVSASSGAGVEIFGMGLAVGDYNLDGFFDFFMTNIGQNMLLNNKGYDQGFAISTVDAGAGVGSTAQGRRVAWGTFFFDFDNDRDEDLYVVSGFLNAANIDNAEDQPNVLLRNDGDGTFTDVSLRSGADEPGVGRGGVFLDYDNDGCLDIFLSNLRQRARLLRNLCNSGNSWLEIKLVGTDSNRDGIGARMTVVVGNRTLMREIAAGSSQIGQNMLRAHFGLGAARRADSVLIRWPSGKVQVLENVAVNQMITVTEPD